MSDSPKKDQSIISEIKEEWYSLIHWDDVPHWLQDNHYIHSGYRRSSYSYKHSFASIFHLHNETVNIWTHLIPGLLSVPCGLALYRTLRPRYERATTDDVLAMSFFFLGAALCLGMSATYHTISNHSPAVNRLGNQLDYLGIVLLITGSFIPSIYYGFWCRPELRLLYWTMIVALGVGCTIVSTVSKFRTPTWRPFRALMFVLMGLSAVFPVLHGLVIYGFGQMQKQMGLSWLVLQGVLYVSGAAIYAARIPEKYNPGKYDLIGSSHQIFHVFVVLAAISHLTGLLKAFDYRHGFPGAVCT